ncbi:MAG: hypothetical protein QOH96_4240 [Blastocatellia bacterium]|jgi:DNA-binding response OmpR family regulator|nr:hypothetical protein [Blastocatellia bacterium]
MSTETILCVDYNNDSSFLLTTLLDFEGFQALSVLNANDALVVVNKKEFDLFILDTHLPDMFGFDLCRKIREQNQLTPIVFYSADAYPHQIQAGLDAGANAYIPKPDFDGLILAVKRLLVAPSSQPTSRFEGQ